jgi:hypothetical protein
MLWTPLIVVMLSSSPATQPAVTQDHETQIGADFRREREALGNDCALRTFYQCIVDLATEDPLHVSVGSLAPQSGFGFGGAFVEHYTPEGKDWKYSWDVDAVRASSGSWRGGAYMKIVHDKVGAVGVRPAGSPHRSRARDAYPIFNIYVESSSLENLLVSGQPFKEQQTIVGTSVIYPISDERWNAALLGSVNGRFVRTIGIDATFAQFQEGIRIKPHWLGTHVNTNYVVSVDEFVSDSASQASFHRWNVDLRHTIPLFQDVQRSRETNGPDDCRPGLGKADRCSRVSVSRNRRGAIDLRAFVTSATASVGNIVPFYLQPTLGGSDINGQMILAAYDDYRFRAPSAFALQESLEHSLWGPFGAYLLLEQGKVAGRAGDFGSSDLLHSVAIGLTIRAGGFPLINLALAWGGEGHHFIKRIDPSLLGGGGRPSLF